MNGINPNNICEKELLVNDYKKKTKWQITNQEKNTTISLREDNTIYSRIEIRKDTNKAIDFALFMVRACRDKFIRERDVVVMDNAKIHHTPETLLQIKKCMDVLSAKIQYLPTYSPETNPCELVFSLVKEDLKGKVLEDGTFATLIESAFAKVTKDNIYSFHRHCIHNSTRIEDQVFFLIKYIPSYFILLKSTKLNNL